jgi:hypothetical protein
MSPIADDNKIIKGNTVTVVVRQDDILEINDNSDWNEPDSLEIVKEDTALIKKIVGGHPHKALLIEVPSKHVSREILSHFQVVETGAIARGLLLSSFATKIVGNLYLKLSGGKANEAGRIVPVRLFTKKEDAIKWLLEQIEKHKK